MVVGGELTMDNLEIRHSARANVGEAPLQLKSNCGSLLIDDFGRQRMNHAELLNRWIIPLEKRYDFLTLASGKKIQVPFDQLIIFSTNLDPNELVDKAFYGAFPTRFTSPTRIRRSSTGSSTLPPTIGFAYSREAVEHLLNKHYRPCQRPLRRCHPRDLLLQVHNYCSYSGFP